MEKNRTLELGQVTHQLGTGFGAVLSAGDAVAVDSKVTVGR